MVKIYPKCLNKKELAYTATGYLLPCCWLDVPTGWSEPQIKRLMQKHLLLENNEKVEDIINSNEYVTRLSLNKTNNPTVEYTMGNKDVKINFTIETIISFYHYQFV